MSERLGRTVSPNELHSLCVDLARAEGTEAQEEAVLCIRDHDAALRKELAEALERVEQWEGRRLARNQPCGCVTCTCDSVDRCYGCGAKNCNSDECVTECVTQNDSGLNAVWEQHPWKAELERVKKLERLLSERVPKTNSYAVAGEYGDWLKRVIVALKGPTK